MKTKTKQQKYTKTRKTKLIGTLVFVCEKSKSRGDITKKFYMYLYEQELLTNKCQCHEFCHH